MHGELLAPDLSGLRVPDHKGGAIGPVPHTIQKILLAVHHAGLWISSHKGGAIEPVRHIIQEVLFARHHAGLRLYLACGRPLLRRPMSIAMNMPGFQD
jgi:hypothetical protein